MKTFAPNAPAMAREMARRVYSVDVSINCGPFVNYQSAGAEAHAAAKTDKSGDLRNVRRKAVYFEMAIGDSVEVVKQWRGDHCRFIFTRIK
ncbi:hypothetical protein [Atlantibacter hermannii]|uniref:hypothetical protein n=1 Tax=Atlantibacter hermannii TaxID=565 RepID=UPI0028A61F59|nr:hypothetical protein [Atlantibacter hermannii]